MYKHDHSKQLAGTIALCALAALGAGAAQAQVTFISAPSALGSSTIRTAQYPMGTAAGIVPQAFSVPTTDGSNSVSFTATSAAATTTAGFESFVADATIAPQFTTGDVVEDTTVATPNGNFPTAPLLINFQKGVSGFGLFAQDFNNDSEQFTLNVFAGPNGTLPLGSFTYAATDNTSSAGVADFVGATTTLGLPLIQSATLSSFSVASGTNPNNGSNDFYFGPTRISAPVPEASTVVGFGMGVALFAGLALVARRRKVGSAS